MPEQINRDDRGPERLTFDLRDRPAPRTPAANLDEFLHRIADAIRDIAHNDGTPLLPLQFLDSHTGISGLIERVRAVRPIDNMVADVLTADATAPDPWIPPEVWDRAVAQPATTTMTRAQLVDHINLLEAQLERITIERDEAHTDLDRARARNKRLVGRLVAAAGARDEFRRRLDQPATPNIGLATTRQLLLELADRMNHTQNSDSGRQLGRMCLAANEGLAPGVLARRGGPADAYQTGGVQHTYKIQDNPQA